MPITINGKQYQKVSERLIKLREMWPDAIINTELEVGQNSAFVKAVVEADNRFATGHAFCQLGEDKAVEKCESVAVGRAMSFLHPDLMGEEIASADEMADWNRGTVEKEFAQKYRRYGEALQRNLVYCGLIQDHLDEGRLSEAWSMWNEIDEEDRQALRVAATKGGWLTVEQGKRLKEASDQDFDPERGVYRSIADKVSNG